MKEKLKNSPVLQKWFYTQSPLIITRPALRETAVCLGYLICGFLLSCGRLGEYPAPFALSFLAAAGGGIRGLTCLVGTVTGYLTMQPFSQGLQLSSTGILIYVCCYIFGSLWVTKHSWFRCIVAGTMTGAVGIIFLLSQRVTPELVTAYLETVLLAALMPLSYGGMVEGKRSPGVLTAISSFLVGAAALPLPPGMRLGIVAGIALTCFGARGLSLPHSAAMAISCGLGLDAALMTGGFWTMVLGCGGSLGALVKRRYGALRLLVCTAAASAAALYTGNIPAGFWRSLGLGAAVSLILPGGLLAGRDDAAALQSCDLVEQGLSCGSEALLKLYEAVGADPQTRVVQEKNRIFDKAAARVCRRCSQYSRCWEKGAQDTYQMLQPVHAALSERGEVKREDFSETFSERCRQLEELTAAINQEADSIVCQNQIRRRNEECRLIASRILLHTGRMAEHNARLLRRPRCVPEEAYAAKLGVAARGRHGMKVSGDRGISLHTENGYFYVILCDGVGTGEEAAQESRVVVDTLAELITAGMPPENAMEMISGMYILRDSGGFATMDVLELSLLSGQGTLYKWGAAPSYVKSGNTVKRIGSAAPPPGIGVGSTYGAEVLQLSLWGGDLLVLVSDGVVSDETEALIRSFEGENVKALANQLIECAADIGGEDDMTAAVVRLTEYRL